MAADEKPDGVPWYATRHTMMRNVRARRPDECGRIYADLLKQARLEDVVAMYEPNATVVMRDGRAITGHSAIRAWLMQVLVAGAIDLHLTVVKTVDACAPAFSI